MQRETNSLTGNGNDSTPSEKRFQKLKKVSRRRRRNSTGTNSILVDETRARLYTRRYYDSFGEVEIVMRSDDDYSVNENDAAEADIKIKNSSVTGGARSGNQELNSDFEIEREQLKIILNFKDGRDKEFVASGRRRKGNVYEFFECDSIARDITRNDGNSSNLSAVDEESTGSSENESESVAVKQFECSSCSKMFFRKNSLTLHTKKVPMEKVNQTEDVISKSEESSSVKGRNGRRKRKANNLVQSYKPTKKIHISGSKRRTETQNTKLKRREFILKQGGSELDNSTEPDEQTLGSGERKRFKCPNCPKTFSRVDNLKRHKLIHSGERPHQCKTSAKRFNQQGYLRSHMRIHTGEKPFQCPICEKTFRFSSSVNVHIRTHTKEKPFECNLCHKMFPQRVNMRYHVMLTHKREKPHKCPACESEFNCTALVCPP